MWWWVLGLAISLMVIAYEDIKNRLVHIASLSICFLFSIATSLEYKSFYLVTLDFILNIILLGLFSVTVYAYIRLKYGSQRKVNEYIGIGDLLFLIAVAPLFTINNFLFFCIITFIATLIFHFLTYKIFKNKNIPLAGYQSLLLICFLPIYPF